MRSGRPGDCSPGLPRIRTCRIPASYVAHNIRCVMWRPPLCGVDTRRRDRAVRLRRSSPHNVAFGRHSEARKAIRSRSFCQLGFARLRAAIGGGQSLTLRSMGMSRSRKMPLRSRGPFLPPSACRRCAVIVRRPSSAWIGTPANGATPARLCACIWECRLAFAYQFSARSWLARVPPLP